MRVIHAALPALLVAIAGPALGFAGDVAGTCAAALRCGGQRLPAPITITTGRTADRIARDGRVSRISAPRSPYPVDATWFPGTGTWYRIEHGNLMVGRGRQSLWRSRGEIAANQIGVVAAGPRAVAFQHDHSLYLAPFGGTERPVASRELPLGWTTGGLYTYSYPRRELLLRGDTGAIVRTIARRPLEYQFDLSSRRLYFLTPRVLVGADGARTWRLGSLSSLGMSADTSLQPLGGLVELVDDRRLVLVRPDGSLFASTPVRHLDRISSFLAIAPGATAVGFTGVTGPARDPTAETVYLLRAGAQAAIALHSEAGAFENCAQWANVEWHGNWLLYSNNDGNLAAIETVGTHRAVELSDLARRLLGGRHGFGAHWSQ